jgi:vanillate O-demethylase ferredoxin subunit
MNMTAMVHFDNEDCLAVRVVSVDHAAEDVLVLELRSLYGSDLPSFTAGAHIDVELPIPLDKAGPLVRQYSLCNDPVENHRYVIAVGRDAQSRGGSEWVHGHIRPGDRLRISAPRNHFPLSEDAPQSVLIAGGIGVTPLLAMARRLSALRRPWTFYYCARSPQRAAFLGELHMLPGTIVPVFDGIPGGERIDLSAVVREALPCTHFYCCGPSSLMEAFEQAASSLPLQQVHVEWFKARPLTSKATQPASDAAFEIRLAKTNICLEVPADKSVLDVLIEAGISIQHSCCDGLCGTCETRVLEGQPDHRDSVLLGDDAKCTDRMMVCVSRSVGSHLTLDL